MSVCTLKSDIRVTSDQPLTNICVYLLPSSFNLFKGKQLDEAKAINLSLSALGNCIQALIDKDISHVPFRTCEATLV